MGPDLVDRQRRAQQSDAAVDVVPNPARGHDAFGQIERGDSADRKSVSKVNIGHGQRIRLDPGQRRDVGELLERWVVLHLAEQRAVRIQATRNAHPGKLGHGDIPREFIDRNQRRDSCHRREHPSDVLGLNVPFERPVERRKSIGGFQGLAGGGSP